MKESVVIINNKGRVTIPLEIRKALKLKPGDKVAFIVDNDNVVRLEPSSTLKAGFGAVKPQGTPEDFKELRDKLREWAAQKVEEEL